MNLFCCKEPLSFLMSMDRTLIDQLVVTEHLILKSNPKMNSPGFTGIIHPCIKYSNLDKIFISLKFLMLYFTFLNIFWCALWHTPLLLLKKKWRTIPESLDEIINSSLCLCSHQFLTFLTNLATAFLTLKQNLTFTCFWSSKEPRETLGWFYKAIYASSLWNLHPSFSHKFTPNWHHAFVPSAQAIALSPRFGVGWMLYAVRPSFINPLLVLLHSSWS
jgi:hypothetical protein